ncbi:serine/threonine-protein kinase [Actinoplanes campanulatus]|uniref:non-specific serine/threonine protein kinase n=1 Tax=Actinoplanes campanulatus TaxID=113559 RepID=A0A7W5ADS7_9ACTN|nr:serine/threonine-protein kinase [Actinoplanes campanulatus]MBB3094114.1 serine/threonine-protein kinase [Actinoplanes campanulatus]
MSADVLQAGVRLSDRYRLHRRLGAGGMGEVWLAVDEVLQRYVAVKAMLPGLDADPDFGRRFTAEATSMARINHPAVASVHDFGHSLGVAFLVMEFVDGESLAQRLTRGRLGPEETMRLIAQVADGLQAVHAQGLVHRDIKPANLLVRADGTAVITDFGIARHEDAGRLTVSGAILGTPTYLSPEQVRGEPAGPRSDLYSLGLVAYECLAGEKPFAGDNPYAVALQRLQSGPRTMKVRLPMPVQAVVERALAVDPKERWQSASELASAARASVTGVAPVAAPAVRRSVLPAVLAAFAAMALVVAGLVIWGSRPDSNPVVTTTTTGAGTTQEQLPVRFTTCAGGYCPVEPMCWAGLNVSSGVPESPRRLDCSEEHVWETYAAVDVPAGGVVIDDDDPLIEKSEIAVACGEESMATRSRRPDRTSGWLREAWPIKVGEDTLLHCIARPVGGEATGTFFKSA